MVGVNVVAADTTEEAKMLSTTHQQQFLNLIRNTPAQIQPPVETMEGIATPFEKESTSSQSIEIDHYRKSRGSEREAASVFRGNWSRRNDY